MLKHHLYYAVKPFLPWGLRMRLRRFLARRILLANSDVWPVDPYAIRKPAGWTGWPEGKPFAVVLTHDVEGPEGLARCRQLAEVEMEMGFRSSFNFVPEGSYSVTPELRNWLTENGFEVGVHDLAHDGKLFRSKKGFEQKAKRINQYLRDWGAKGFRAGFMLRNLDWYHQLEVQYDASTFDTDPFEPLPDGAGTLFPHWMQDPDGASGKGYIELPYTLPQDSTLFLLLQLGSPGVWTRKLDWVAQHNGMALVNVHPDYICFDGELARSRTYPVSHYRELLQHIRGQHAGRYWNGLPREVAAHARAMSPVPTVRQPRRICMVSHSFYENDNRVSRYAESLAARGDFVEVFALRRSESMPKQELLNGVLVHRIQDRIGKREKGKLSYLWPLLRFLFVSSRHVSRHHGNRPYDLVHVHNIPDFIVFSAWYPKVKGTPVILDVHDIVPEFFTSKFGQKPKGMMFGLLKLMERVSAAFADHVIIANDLWLEPYSKRTGTKGRCTPYINYVNSALFTPNSDNRNDGKQIVLFPGGLQWHQGLDIAIRAFVSVSKALPNAEFHIYGDGNAKDSLVELTAELGLNEKVRFFDPMSMLQIAKVMATADLGVVPKRADSFGNEAYSTKIMEFMSAGVPVVISSTKIDRFYFDDSVVRFFESGNVEMLAREMIAVLTDAELRQKLVKNGLAYADRNCWDRKKQEYFTLVDGLCEGTPTNAT